MKSWMVGIVLLLFLLVGCVQPQVNAQQAFSTPLPELVDVNAPEVSFGLETVQPELPGTPLPSR